MVCIVIAALLQYFFVAMFCWAVCEGLQLFMTLTTGKNRNYTRLKYFYIIGWSKFKTLKTFCSVLMIVLHNVSSRCSFDRWQWMPCKIVRNVFEICFGNSGEPVENYHEINAFFFFVHSFPTNYCWNLSWHNSATWLRKR